MCAADKGRRRARSGRGSKNTRTLAEGGHLLYESIGRSKRRDKAAMFCWIEKAGLSS